MISILNTLYSTVVRGAVSDLIGGLFAILQGRSAFFENESDSKELVEKFKTEGILDKASIVLTPTGYSVDAIHNVKPSSAPFGDMLFVQDGASTRINENGLVVSNATDIPRIDYSKGEGAILTELGSTNRVKHSEDLSQSGWLTNSVGITSVSMTDPRGNTSSVSNVFRYSSGSTAGIRQDTSVFSSGKGVGVSAWVYNPEGTSQQVWIGYGNISSGNGTAITVPRLSWQRIEHKSTGGVNANEFHIAPAAFSNLRVWGCQFEIGTKNGGAGKVSSYIPTTSAVATRQKDSYRNGGAASLIGAQEGVLFFEGAALADIGVSRGIALSSNNSNTNRVALFYRSISNEVLCLVQGSGGYISLQASGITQTNFNKIAVKYKSGDIALWVNGVEVDTKTNSLTFNAALNELAFDQGNGGLHFDGHVKQLAVFKEVLSDAELAALTS